MNYLITHITKMISPLPGLCVISLVTMSNVHSNAMIRNSFKFNITSKEPQELNNVNFCTLLDKIENKKNLKTGYWFEFL